MIKLEDAYFGIMKPNGRGGLIEDNLFCSMRVLRSVALWKTRSELHTPDYDPLLWCFGDTRWRAEYEWFISSLVDEGGWKKVDVYGMYVEPNRDLLLGIVDNISVASCKKWLREHKR